MSYTDVPSFSDNTRFTKAQMNTYLRDNLEALKNPPTDAYISVGHTADWSTTSTSFTDVDATNLALSITTTGDGAGGNSDVMIGICGTVYTSGAARIYFQILEDGSTLNIDGDGWFVTENTGARGIGQIFLRVNASPGAHSYKLQWKVSSGTAVLLANSGVSTRDCRFQFWAREVS